MSWPPKTEVLGEEGGIQVVAVASVSRALLARQSKVIVTSFCGPCPWDNCSVQEGRSHGNLFPAEKCWQIPGSLF